MKFLFLNILFISFLVSCQTVEKLSQYPKQVGDIEFDKNLDDLNFKICNNDKTFQYYNLEKGFKYKGEKLAILDKFKNSFKFQSKNSENGYITIRFLVNCEGKTGMFRVQEMNFNYQKTEFDRNLVQELLKFTKNLDGWENFQKIDYYQYLTYKIENGKVVKILP